MSEIRLACIGMDEETIPRRPYRISLETQRAGGRARALALSPKRRRLIARQAANARWRKNGSKGAPRGKN